MTLQRIVLIGFAGLLAAIVTALTFAPARLAKRHILLAGGVAVAGAALASRCGPFQRRGRALLVLTPLAAAAVGAGAAGGLQRARAVRLPALEACLDPSKVSQTSGLRPIIDYFRGRPPRDAYSLPRMTRQEVDEVSDQVLSSVFRFLSFRPVILREELSWDEDPLDDKTWQWSLHTMPFIPALTERYGRGGDARYLQKAESFILDWIDDNLLWFYDRPIRYAWHDHVTALRVRGWLPFWEAWIRSPLCGDEEAELVLRAISAHGERLADPSFYTESHNHGVEQDIALMAIAATFPELRKSEEWNRLAVVRLGGQVGGTVSPRGVHKEHSPGYHIFMIGVLTEAHDFAKKHGLSLGGAAMEDLLSRMARVAAYMIQPDGRTVAVGDTTWEPTAGPSHPVLSRYAATDPVLRFVLTRGREGEPGEEALVLKEEGYAILREAWRAAPEFDQPLYVFFTAAANKDCAHKQADDLSFTVYGRGLELIVDPGHYSYDDTEPGRQYVVAARAHNVVLVDGKSFTGFTARIDNHTTTASGNNVVQASHENYAGLRHRRTLYYARPATLFVVDELRRTGSATGTEELAADHEFTLLFHLAPELEAIATGDRSGARAEVIPKDPHPVRLRLEALADGARTARVVRGARDPLQGWVSRGHRHLEPAPVVMFSSRGREALFVTSIEVADRKDNDSPVRPQCVVTADEIQFRWSSGPSSDAASIRRMP